MLQYCDLGDVRLAYRRVGAPGRQPPLVLLHGFTGSSADFDDVVEELARDREVITLDHRGHGDSTKFGTEAAYSLAMLTSDAVRFLEALGLEIVDLLGHSMGGWTAQLLTMAHPGRVRSLLLMDTAPQAIPRGLASLVIAATSGIARIVGTAPLAALLVALAGSGAGPAEKRRIAAVRGLDPALLRPLSRDLARHPSLVGRLGEITCPTTVIVGERDRALHEGALLLKRGIQGAELHVIRGARHSPQIEARGEWLEAVRHHLARAATARR